MPTLKNFSTNLVKLSMPPSAWSLVAKDLAKFQEDLDLLNLPKKKAYKMPQNKHKTKNFKAPKLKQKYPKEPNHEEKHPADMQDMLIADQDHDLIIVVEDHDHLIPTPVAEGVTVAVDITEDDHPHPDIPVEVKVTTEAKEDDDYYQNRQKIISYQILQKLQQKSKVSSNNFYAKRKICQQIACNHVTEQ